MSNYITVAVCGVVLLCQMIISCSQHRPPKEKNRHVHTNLKKNNFQRFATLQLSIRCPNSDRTCNNLEGAAVSFNGRTATSNSNGIVAISDEWVLGEAATVVVSLAGFTTETRSYPIVNLTGNGGRLNLVRV